MQGEFPQSQGFRWQDFAEAPQFARFVILIETMLPVPQTPPNFVMPVDSVQNLTPGIYILFTREKPDVGIYSGSPSVSFHDMNGVLHEFYSHRIHIESVRPDLDWVRETEPMFKVDVQLDLPQSTIVRHFVTEPPTSPRSGLTTVTYTTIQGIFHMWCGNYPIYVNSTTSLREAGSSYNPLFKPSF